MSLREAIRSMLRQRGAVIGINRRNVELVYRHNPRHLYPLADDKIIAKERLTAAGVPVPETIAVGDGLFALGGMVERLAGRGDFVVKPANGGGGNGILVVGERVDGGWRRAGEGTLTHDQLFRHLADIVFGAYSRGRLWDRALVEQRVVPHEAFAALWADGLCDVRVITLHAEPLLAMVRVPTRVSAGRANLHQGGLGLAVDLADGRVRRAFRAGHTIDSHPDTGAPLLGLELPAWPEMLATARAAAHSVPLGYLGVDLAVDRDRGPLVLEINARPGLEIQNVHGRGLATVIREVAA